MQPSITQEVNNQFIATAITALIAAIISIACYVYLLIKEIKQRSKTLTANEPVVDTLEPMQDNQAEQE